MNSLNTIIIFVYTPLLLNGLSKIHTYMRSKNVLRKFWRENHMNEYIEECYRAFIEIKKANEWFLRKLAYAIVQTVKEAVEECVNE